MNIQAKNNYHNYISHVVHVGNHGVYKCRNSLFSSEQGPPRKAEPVSADDGHSPQCCRPCMRKFLAAECFVSMATNSYQKKTIDGDE